jgi:glycosyltransferase involved in cell wall biosynthesis
LFSSHSLPRFLYWIFFSSENGHAVAISQAVMNSLPERIRKKTRILYNGVKLPESSASSPVKQKWNFQQSDRLICSIGRLVPWKGFDLLLQAFEEIAPRFPQARLFILGDVFYWDQNYKQKLMEKASSGNLKEKVLFPGYVENTGEYLLASEFLVLPSEKEPFGRVLIEAMAYAKPVIAFRTGGIPEIVISEKTGLLIEKRDSHSLAGAMERLLIHPEQAVEMGKAGYARAKTLFSIEKHVDEMQNYLEQVNANK